MAGWSLKMARFEYDRHFKLFADSLHGLITGYGEQKGDFTEMQKRQVELLVSREREFKTVLQTEYPEISEQVYLSFINYITTVKRNILACKPFFRERQDAFAQGISPAIREKRCQDLYNFDINYQFVSFVLDCPLINKENHSKLFEITDKIYQIRTEIVEMNMPLAISRAKMFWSRTPKSHLTYMDVVQISAEALVNAVDKFVLPYRPVFRSTIIGRIKGDLIEEYSKPMLHFYPSDRRKLYRANKAQRGGNILDFDTLAERVNDIGVKLDKPTSPAEIQDLVNASSHFSLDSLTPETDDSEGAGLVESYPADEDVRPDVIFETHDLRLKLLKAIKKLNALERKLIKLKGI